MKSFHRFANNLAPGNPDPPTLAFLRKSKGTPKERKGFSLRGTPKILGKGREKHPKKARKIGKPPKTRKTKKVIGLSQDQFWGSKTLYLKAFQSLRKS